MYKTFAKDSKQAYQQYQQQRQHAVMSDPNPQYRFVGMHAARCFLAALSGYSGSGWMAAEEYACSVLPTEVRLFCLIAVSYPILSSPALPVPLSP